MRQQLAVLLSAEAILNLLAEKLETFPQQSF